MAATPKTASSRDDEPAQRATAGVDASPLLPPTQLLDTTEMYLKEVMPLTAARLARVAAARIGEPLQIDVVLLTTFAQAGLRPGATATARPGASLVALRAADADIVVDLPDGIARHVFVTCGTVAA